MLVNAIDIDAGQIHLVQRDDDRHAGRAGVADGFFGLRHDAVVGGDDQHGDIGDVRAAGAHFGEGFVARRIDEGDRTAVLLDAIGADVLGDAALFLRGHVDAEDAVQQRGLPVVHVAEERDDRRTRLERGGIVGGIQLGQELLFDIGLMVELGVDAQFGGQQFGHFRIEIRGDVGHGAHLQQLGEDRPRGHAEGLGECSHGARQLHDHALLPRRGGVGARSFDAGFPAR